MLLTLSKLSAPNCLFALRSKRKGRSSRPRIMQLEVVDSHNAPPLTCFLLLRLFRFGFDFVFGLKFVCRRVSLDYLVSAAALILFDQESPSPLTCFNNCVVFITEILDFSCCFSESPFHAEVRFIRYEKSRISTVLSGVMYAKSIVIRVKKRGARGELEGD